MGRPVEGVGTSAGTDPRLSAGPGNGCSNVIKRQGRAGGYLLNRHINGSHCGDFHVGDELSKRFRVCRFNNQTMPPFLLMPPRRVCSSPYSHGLSTTGYYYLITALIICSSTRADFVQRDPALRAWLHSDGRLRSVPAQVHCDRLIGPPFPPKATPPINGITPLPPTRPQNNSTGNVTSDSNASATKRLEALHPDCSGPFHF